jgi:hypothetical protein
MYRINIPFDLADGRFEFSRWAIKWLFSRLVFENLHADPGELEATLQNYEMQAKQILQSSPLFEEVNFDDDAQVAEAFEHVKQMSSEREGLEYWSVMVCHCIPEVRRSIEQGDAQAAAWVMAAVVTARSMLMFHQYLEEPVWRGHTVARLDRLLEIWEENGDNADESFWQETLVSNSYLLSIVFSFPVFIIREQAYVGGKSLEYTGGGLVDFLLENRLSRNTILVEIKTPLTQLLGPEYRNGIFSASAELTGAITQVSSYKDSLLKEYYSLAHKTGTEFDVFSPKCLVIAGTFEREINDMTQQQSFELFRNGLRDVEVITFDELFGKIMTVMDLFGESSIGVDETDA